MPLGCGESADAQIRAKVQQLARAIAREDYQTVCAQVLDPALVRRLASNGTNCPYAMRLQLGSVRHPVISVGKVIIHGDRAWVIALTTAQGQRASLGAIGLRDTSRGWRILELGAPVSAATGG